MCGIVGLITSKKKSVGRNRLESFMTYGLMLDSSRGEDSTGVFCVPRGKKRNSLIAKDIGNGFDFVLSQRFYNQIKDINRMKWMFGHNRAATRGSVKEKNAHPFTFGKVTLIHNGTVNEEGLPHIQEEIKVDSAQLAYSLSQLEPDKAVELLESIDGGFTLVWHDQRNDSINIARNRQRPLHVTSSKDNGTLFFMSQGDHLAATMKAADIGYNAIYELAALKMLTFKGNNMRPEVRDFKSFFSKPHRPAHGKVPAAGPTSTPVVGPQNTTPAGTTSPTKSAATGRPFSRVYSDKTEAQTPWKSFPEQFLFSLLTLDMEPEDVFGFRPTSWMEPTQSFSTSAIIRKVRVRGTVFHPTHGWIRAEVLDVPSLVVRMLFQTKRFPVWGVAPRVVLEDNLGEPVVYCSLVDFVPPLDWDLEKDEQEIPFDKTVDDDDDPVILIVVAGQEMTNETLLHRLKSPCAMCDNHLESSLEVARWVGEYQDQPLCTTCAQSHEV